MDATWRPHTTAATLRFYLNGTQVASLAQTGAIATSANPLQIGGDSIYGQFFQGIIDEVRIYSVALTPAQIQADMDTPVERIVPAGQLQPGECRLRQRRTTARPARLRP